MSAAAPTFAQIKAHVAAIRKKAREPNARVIGLRATGRWAGKALEQDGADTYVIRQCDSSLALRLALREPVDAHATKVLITPLDDQQLSDDIRLRLARGKLYPIAAWPVVQELFQARAIDPRLTRPGQDWIAEALLESIPAEGYPPARGGFLDAETVWPLLLRRVIGLDAETPDVTALLRWSLDADATRRFRQSGASFQESAIAWLAETAGPIASLVLQALRGWDQPDAVPLGLAAGVVFHPAAKGSLEKAAGKLEERFLGSTTALPETIRRWSAAATEVVRALRHTEPKAYRQNLQRGDDILRSIQAESFAHLSDTSPLGFDQRLARLGQSLNDLGAQQAWHQPDAVYSARDAVRAHDQAAREARRVERIEMALRLVRWLGEAERAARPEPPSLAQAADEHLTDGGFVDWARLSLRAGDPVQELSQAYASLFNAVTRLREQQARHFARLLADWTAAGAQGDQVVPVERILEQVVAPLAAERAVLVIVIDGMSVAVCRALLDDLARHDWTMLCEPGRTRNRPGVATIPSTTEFSRTSLWCGHLKRGTAGDAEAGFAAHPALLAQCRAGHPPVLFHKVALQEAGDAVLASEVRKEITSTHRKVVGVVVNAVDDHLAKGDQIDVQWSRDEIKVLPALLHEARNAGRVVVLTSDHGHVLDCQTEARLADGGERWRRAAGDPAPDECVVHGPRVLVEGHKLIAPWSERVRYVAAKKNGYHGGLTPQEMVVPIVVLSGGDVPKGWQEQPVDIPAWWDEPLSKSLRAEVPAPKLKPRVKPSDTLFDLEAADDETAPPTPGVATTRPEWVARLLRSSVYEEQKRLGGRGLPADDTVARLLGALDERGGKMTTLALARALAYPEVRLPGLLAKLQRLLNVDGYAVLDRDDASHTIALNRALLLTQFDLAAE